MWLERFLFFVSEKYNSLYRNASGQIRIILCDLNFILEVNDKKIAATTQPIWNVKMDFK